MTGIHMPNFRCVPVPSLEKPTLPPHIMRMVEKAYYLDKSATAFAETLDNMPMLSRIGRSSKIKESILEIAGQVSDLEKEIGRETLKHFGGEV